MRAVLKATGEHVTILEFLGGDCLIVRDDGRQDVVRRHGLSIITRQR